MDKILNKYKINVDENGYVNGFWAVLDDDYDYYGQMADYPDACEGWTKFENGEFIVDENKKAEIEAKKQTEALRPSDQDRLEAQALYTALMTDTLLPEEEF